MDVSPSNPAPGDSAERLHHLEELFHQALSYPRAERAELARSWCPTDLELLSQLLALLKSDDSVEELMAASASTISTLDPQVLLLRNSTPSGSANPAAPQQDPWLGRLLGPFHVEHILGRGGMGVVYLGQRIAEDFQQTVAIKVIARHLRSSPAVSQFLLERETLAHLQHPNIARLLDGGVYEGVPYVVMEYVDGVRIDALCDDPAITADTTIRLILQLCEAVAYVHRNLILHRDLKPGNVMVTSEGVVKLLDFGTLKLMSAIAASSDMTQAGMRSVTLRYASPEHIRGDAVSTASDVYSLGMMLYRLLAGHLPEGMDNLPISEYLERLKTAKIPPPCTGRAIPRRLAKDLGAIILKGIRYEPEARYSSVSALAADLSNALADAPVSAREGNLRYRASKFYRRRRTGILGTAAVLLVLAAGLAEVAHQGRIARAQTLRAEAGIESERKLAHLLLFDYFEQLKQLPGSTDAQRKAVTQALTYLDSLTHIPPGSALELDKVQAYSQMGMLLGSPYEENLGDAPGSIKILEKVIPVAQRMVEKDPHNLAYLQASAAAQTALGQVYLGTGNPKQAAQYLIPAGEISRLIADTPGVGAPMLMQAAYVLNTVGDVYGQESDLSIHDSQNAARTYEQSLTINQKALALDSHCIRCRSGIALEFWKLGMMARQDDQDKAAEYYRNGLATLSVFTPAEQATTRIRRMDTFIRQRLGEVYLSNGHPQEGVRMLEILQHRFQLAVAADKIDTRPRWDLGPLDGMLAEGYKQLRQYEKASDAYRGYVEMMNFLVHLEPQNRSWQQARAEALLNYGRLQTKLGQLQAGQRASDEGVALIVSLAQKPNAETNELDLAANSLVELHRDPTRDVPLALSFAQRDLAASPHPTVDQLLTLANAQRFASLTAQSKDSVQNALNLLALHPKSIGSAAQREQAHKLLLP
jgi:tetratricopeptide (TPR) repeat protein/predicted Ser/Thr protein kinase